MPPSWVSHQNSPADSELWFTASLPYAARHRHDSGTPSPHDTGNNPRMEGRLEGGCFVASLPILVAWSLAKAFPNSALAGSPHPGRSPPMVELWRDGMLPTLSTLRFRLRSVQGS